MRYVVASWAVVSVRNNISARKNRHLLIRKLISRCQKRSYITSTTYLLPSLSEGGSGKGAEAVLSPQARVKRGSQEVNSFE